MWRILATGRRNLGMKKRSRRVADENILHNLDNLSTVNRERRSGGGWHRGGLVAVLYGIIRAPFSMISCLSDPRMNGADSMWMSAELPQISEVNKTDAG
ncbi:Hypothetical predicted protein [Olea europaea subsp. europaea]|uniref:Uncharacterized protein n=1 Tax=Olea europaea subsp. europaea TaxID=158383 RepID=A0A8S0QIU1_OLEEU|nr:Hypothetical predicted protein [Olea europaea subsp. europaea]